MKFRKYEKHYFESLNGADPKCLFKTTWSILKLICFENELFVLDFVLWHILSVKTVPQMKDVIPKQNNHIFVFDVILKFSIYALTTK